MPRNAPAVKTATYSEDIVLARSGAEIDISMETWVISPEDTIEWSLVPPLPEHVLLAFKKFLQHLIRTSSPKYVAGQFHALRLTLRTLDQHLFLLSPNDAINTAAFAQAASGLRAKVSRDTVNIYLGAYRRWYSWCTDAGFDSFDEDVAADLDERRLGAALKGTAVLSHDPDQGPLNHVEFNGLLSKLRSTAAEIIPLDCRCAMWLSVAFGTNTKNLRLLREDDLLKTGLSDGTEIYELRIPKIKKRTPGERDQFRTRPLDTHIGNLLEKLIENNARAV